MKNFLLGWYLGRRLFCSIYCFSNDGVNVIQFKNMSLGGQIFKRNDPSCEIER